MKSRDELHGELSKLIESLGIPTPVANPTKWPTFKLSEWFSENRLDILAALSDDREKRMREALEFYATNSPITIAADGGDIARNALDGRLGDAGK